MQLQVNAAGALLHDWGREQVRVLQLALFAVRDRARCTVVALTISTPCHLVCVRLHRSPPIIGSDGGTSKLAPRLP